MSVFSLVVLLQATPSPADELARFLAAPMDFEFARAGDEPQAAKPQGTRPAPPSGPFVDFSGSEINPFAGAVLFSGEFEGDADYAVGAMFRVPVPGLLNGNFGAFVEILVSHLQRDLDPEPETPDGMFYGFGTGADYTFVKGKTGFVRGQLGLLYASFGDISGVDDGVGALVGAVGALHWFSQRFDVWFTLNPQLAYDGDDWMLFTLIGIQIGL